MPTEEKIYRCACHDNIHPTLEKAQACEEESSNCWKCGKKVADAKSQFPLKEFEHILCVKHEKEADEEAKEGLGRLFG